MTVEEREEKEKEENEEAPNPADQELTQTYQVRGLRSQSEIRQGSGPDPSERLELTPKAAQSEARRAGASSAES